MEADLGNLMRNANEGLILSLLPILDDFHRSLKQAKNLKEDDPFVAGIQMISTKISRIP